MHLPITERDALVLAAPRLVRAEHYATDNDPYADDEADYAAEQFAAGARALVAALDTDDDDRPAPDEAGAPCSARGEFVKALRDLAQFFADRLDVPIPAYPDLTAFAHGDDDAQWTFVEAAGMAMGVTPTGRDGSHFRAVVTFGPLTYQALAISTGYVADHNERARLANQTHAAQHTTIREVAA